MSESDKEIWRRSLNNEEESDRFTTKPGGPNAPKLPKKKLFKTLEEKKEESKLTKLEKQVKELREEVTELKQAINKIVRKTKQPIVQETNEDKS